MSNEEKRGLTFWRTVPLVALISCATVHTLHAAPEGRSLVEGKPSTTAAVPNSENRPEQIATSDDKKVPAPAYGYIADSYYHNDFFGLTIPIPSNWTAEEPSITHVRGLEAAKEYAGPKFDPKNPDFYFLHASHPTNKPAWDFIPTVIVVARKLDLYPWASSSTAYYSGLFLADPSFAKLTNPDEGAVKFGYLTGFNLRKPTPQRTICETNAVAICKGYVVEFNVTTGDRDTLAKMQDQILRKVTFKEPVK